MKYSIMPPQDRVVAGEVVLNSSKSIANRVLIIRALCQEHFEIDNLSNADDTVMLDHLLSSESDVLDAGAGGTTFRFLTAYLSTCAAKDVILTGSERMQQRPIQVLVNALRQLGADINYTKTDGFPPLHIKGKHLQGGKLSIPADTSSQYISALLLIAPVLKNGLDLTLEGEIVSLPYILMTIRIMQYFGAQVQMEGQIIRVEEGKYQAKPFYVEADWSAASYFYALVALADEATITLHGLSENSLQGDAVIARMMSPWVTTVYGDNCVTLTKATPPITAFSNFQYDFRECPDLAQTVVATLSALHISAALKGLKTLLIKETDRVAALHQELNKYGVIFRQSGTDDWTLHSSAFNAEVLPIPVMHTYEDHRMAMALAPVCLKTKEMLIADPMVVSKSYPAFWDDLKKLGFTVEEV